MTTLIENTFLARTAEEHLAAAARWEAKEQAALKRGEKGQAWDFHLNKLASEARAELAETGGWREVPAMFSLRGDLVRAVAIGEPGDEEFRFIVRSDDPETLDEIEGSFTPSRSGDTDQFNRENAQSGVYVGSVKVQMKVVIRDHVPFKSVPNKGYVDVRRAFEVYDEQAVVVDSGH